MLCSFFVFKKAIKKTIEDSLSDFWSNLGIGFVAFVITPVVCIILLISVIGIWLSSIIFLAYSFMIMLASLLAEISFGAWLIKMIKKEKNYKVDWISVVVGVLGLGILSLLPFVGCIIWLFFMLAGLGVLCRLMFQKIRAK